MTTRTPRPQPGAWLVEVLFAAAFLTAAGGTAAGALVTFWLSHPSTGTVAYSGPRILSGAAIAAGSWLASLAPAWAGYVLQLLARRT